MKLVAIDFETANRDANSACAIGVVSVENNTIIKEEYFLIRPPSSYFEFTYVHGLSWRDVAKAGDFQQVWTQIAETIESADYLVAHNARFDRKVLYACCDFHGIPYPKQEFLCTVDIARKTWNIRPTKLSDVCRHFDIPLQHHQALSDARACAQIAILSNRA
jgi:DNA polymerase III subunit epsilon